MIRIFHSSRMDNSEQAYKAWLYENPTGYVVNMPKSANGTGRKTDVTLTRVHKASCPTINGGEDSAFTTAAYFKCCSPTREEAELEAKTITGLTSLQPCKKCMAAFQETGLAG